MNNGKICISVCAETADEMIAKIRRAELLADMIEVRFDCLPLAQAAFLLAQIADSAFTKPLIATLRASEQGGKNLASLDERAAFWQAKKSDRFSAVDVEEDAFDAAVDWSNRILSFHVFEKSSLNLSDIYKRLCSRNDLIKLAAYAEDITDSIPVWKLIEKALWQDKEIIPIAMGDAGKWTRILGLAHGAYMTYASLDDGEETADGQITASDLIDVYRVRELDKNTELYGVIGDPVSSSLSPYMQNPAFAATGVNAVFIPLLVKDLDEFIRRMVTPATREVELNFGGFSVTMPLKQAIIKHLDEIDPVAERIGAVNTVKISGGKLIGYNTDAHGFITPLKTQFGELKNARVAVIGAGGAARACVYALAQAGADVTVFVRDLQKAEVFKNEFQVKLKQLPTDNSQLQTDLDIVVNATPLGMKGAFENDSPLTAEQLKGVKFVYDLVVRRDDTPLLREAENAGASTLGGLEMLIAQGIKQFAIWTGREAPEELMRESLKARIDKRQ